ncbi:MAG: hypothetical protein HRU33_13895 [Rhodobacteraceae bacterium]|nr:hypothetical protein [Paracoccaceae bacterium]
MHSPFDGHAIAWMPAGGKGRRRFLPQLRSQWQSDNLLAKIPHSAHMFEQNAGTEQKYGVARLSLAAESHIFRTNYEHLPTTNT